MLVAQGASGHTPAAATVSEARLWDYAFDFSSDNAAAHQAGLALVPPALQARDANGSWRTAIREIGLPTGRPQTIVVDVTDALAAAPSSSRNAVTDTTAGKRLPSWRI